MTDHLGHELDPIEAYQVWDSFVDVRLTSQKEPSSKLPLPRQSNKPSTKAVRRRLTAAGYQLLDHYYFHVSNNPGEAERTALANNISSLSGCEFYTPAHVYRYFANARKARNDAPDQVYPRGRPRKTRAGSSALKSGQLEEISPSLPIVSNLGDKAFSVPHRIPGSEVVEHEVVLPPTFAPEPLATAAATSPCTPPPVRSTDGIPDPVLPEGGFNLPSQQPIGTPSESVDPQNQMEVGNVNPDILGVLPDANVSLMRAVTSVECAEPEPRGGFPPSESELAEILHRIFVESDQEQATQPSTAQPRNLDELSQWLQQQSALSTAFLEDVSAGSYSILGLHPPAASMSVPQPLLRPLLRLSSRRRSPSSLCKLLQHTYHIPMFASDVSPLDAYTVMRAFYNHVTSTPNATQTTALAAEVSQLPGCEGFAIQGVQRYFKQKRKNVHKKGKSFSKRRGRSPSVVSSDSLSSATTATDDPFSERPGTPPVSDAVGDPASIGCLRNMQVVPYTQQQNPSTQPSDVTRSFPLPDEPGRQVIELPSFRETTETTLLGRLVVYSVVHRAAPYIWSCIGGLGLYLLCRYAVYWLFV
ncbi:uncharacterized protein BXZ73DRAFT_76393 [Epithele typhae]|uniref:uncharacterized protein n=1 Tax=Epithele typhae TaxID=378194 RepID=UPI0020088A65|nr:uncharacterized protein BXZ73DRAFT_76393 [Epithele typhae]KAH9938900.1 hypothetical protein BXZ73DRAFT_76393 [Epithele typhae]